MARGEIAQLNQDLLESNREISSLNTDLEKTKNDRNQAIRTKDSLTLLGIEMNKALYNSIMWIIVLGLTAMVIILFLLFKRTHAVTIQTRKELEQTMEEFDAYRKSSREKYEKLVVNHHNEIMKLKRS